MTDPFKNAPEWASVLIAENDDTGPHHWNGKQYFAESFEHGARFIEKDGDYDGRLNFIYTNGKVIAERKCFKPGVKVRYVGNSFYSDYHGPRPEFGQVVELVQKEVQKQSDVEVWIVKWHNEEGWLRLVPLVESVLEFIEDDKPSEKAQQFVREYENLTDVNLDVKVVDKVLKNVDNTESDILEVKLLNDGCYTFLENVKFPVTLRLSRSDWDAKLTQKGISISAAALYRIPRSKIPDTVPRETTYFFIQELEVEYDLTKMEKLK